MSDIIYIGTKAKDAKCYEIIASSPKEAAEEFHQKLYRDFFGPWRLVVDEKKDALEFFHALEASECTLDDPEEFWTVYQLGSQDCIEHPTWDDLKRWAS